MRAGGAADGGDRGGHQGWPAVVWVPGGPAVPALGGALGLSTGFLDQVWSSRLGRGHAEGLRPIASVEKDVWQAWFIAPVLAAGADPQT
ncbi:MAG: hypothetical protein ABW234_08735, partial [Actinomycetes bacterium]